MTSSSNLDSYLQMHSATTGPTTHAKKEPKQYDFESLVQQSQDKENDHMEANEPSGYGNDLGGSDSEQTILISKKQSLPIGSSQSRLTSSKQTDQRSTL